MRLNETPDEPIPCRACGELRQTIAGMVFPCRPCSDLATMRAEHQAKIDEAARVSRAREKAVAKWLAAVPPRFRWATEAECPELAKRVMPAPLRACAAITKPTTILLAGRGASGKSSLAAHTVSRWARDGARCSWLSATAVDDLIRASKLGVEEPEELHRAKTVPVLVLDDVGTEGKLGVEAIVSIMHRRHDADLATVSTTGLTYTEIAARYGDGIARRLADSNHVVRMVSATHATP
jgi:DNA replication protein DnaC